MKSDGDVGENSQPPKSRTEKRPLVANTDDNIIKKEKAVDYPSNNTNGGGKNIFKPIGSLTVVQRCAPIRGTLVSVSEWAHTASHRTRYSNFVLKDSSGQIQGVIYRANDLKFEEKFKPGATLKLRDAAVKPVRESYKGKFKGEFELCVPDILKTIEIEIIEKDHSREETDDVGSRILIRDLVEKFEAQELVDVMGVIIDVGDAKKNSYKNGRETITRDIRIIDESSIDIAVTLWHNRAETFNFPVGTVVAIYQVAVRVQSEKTVKSLTLQKTSRLKFNPFGESAERLKSWYSHWDSDRNLSLAEYTARFVAAQNSSATGNKSGENETEDITSDDQGVAASQDSVASVESNFTKINVVNQEIAVGTTIDVLGMIERRKKIEIVRCSNGERLQLGVQLIDDTSETIWMTIWGSKANLIDERENLIVAAKKVQVRCWKNIKEIICTDRTSVLIVEPKINEARRLRKWFERKTASLRTIVPRAPLVSIGNLKDGELSSILGILTKKNQAKIIRLKFASDIARTIEMIDDSRRKILVALWGEAARDFDFSEESIIFVANLKIYAQNKLYGASTPTSHLKIKPDEFRENVKRLERWYARYKSNELMVPD